MCQGRSRGFTSPVPNHDCGCAVMPAKKGSSVSSLFTDSARGVETTRSVTWWKVANLASELNDTRKANVAALGPQQCLITNSTTDVELYHLVDRRSSLAVVRYLAWHWLSPSPRFHLRSESSNLPGDASSLPIIVLTSFTVGSLTGAVRLSHALESQ